MKSDHIISLISAIKYKADKFIISELKKYGAPELAPSHGEILNALFNYDSLSMKQIASIIDRDKSTVTTLVKKLIDLGYVTRENDKVDKRMVFVSLTEKGKSFRPIFDNISSQLLEKTYTGFSKDEIKEIIPLLEKLNKFW